LAFFKILEGEHRDKNQEKKYEGEWTDTYNNLKSQMASLVSDSAAVWSEREKTEFQQWQAALGAYGDGFRKVVRDVANGTIKDTLSANAAIREAKDKFRVLLDGTVKVGEQKLANAKSAQAHIAQRHQTLALVLVSAVSGCVGLCLLLVSTVPASITKPIKMLSDAAAAMSTGNLQQVVPTTLKVRDFTGLAETLERMRISLQVMMGRFAASDNGAATTRPGGADKGSVRSAKAS
jgi:methyl-accepting chemotaxis protein